MSGFIATWKPDWAFLAIINWIGAVAGLVFIFGSPTMKAVALMFITLGLAGIAGMVFTAVMLLLQRTFYKR